MRRQAESAACTEVLDKWKKFNKTGDLAVPGMVFVVQSEKFWSVQNKGAGDEGDQEDEEDEGLRGFSVHNSCNLSDA